MNSPPSKHAADASDESDGSDTSDRSAAAGAVPTPAPASAAPGEPLVVPPLVPGEALVLPPRPAAEAREVLAVFSAAGVPYLVEREDATGWTITVPAPWAEQAVRQLADYDRERRAWPPAPPPAAADEPELGDEHWWSAALATALLLAFYHFTGPFDAARPALAAGAADAQDILAGQWWRLITALTLHGDFGHIAGNSICAFLIGYVVCRYLGHGLAWFAVLLTGAFGNLGATLVYHDAHVSVGFSTAVFGALGLLAALRAAALWQAGRRDWRSWGLPLLGALGLLGLLGAAPNVDLLAHLFGFLAGIALGFPAHALRPCRCRWPVQWLAAAATLALLLLAWALALRHLPAQS